jgi:UDP-N-acetylmuramoylalanine--D-glutamate ligase
MSVLPGSSIFRGERNLAGQRVGVVGLARSGAAAVEFLADRGATVVGFDTRPLDALSVQARHAAGRCEAVFAPYDAGTHPDALDALVISPGVPTQSPLIQAARAAGAQIVGEVELAYRFCDAPMAAVTGTCGKGTAVTTLGALLEAGGVPHLVAGNIGLPLISQMERSGELDVVVAEISSFQLETTTHFHPAIAALLNVTEDHLERYPDFEAYVAAKRLIFRNQTSEDYAIFCLDDPVTAGVAAESPTRATILTVALGDAAANGRLEGDRLVLQLPGQAPQVMATRADLVLSADHHVINVLVAGLAARLCGVPVEAMPEALRSYQPAPHLMTLVGEFGGVRYIDDSKATNPASAIADLKGIAGPVIVIAGGKEKDTDFTEFGQVLAQRAKAVLLMGECAPRIAEAVGRPGLCRTVGGMDEALEIAVRIARPGDTVALCPACSSLDMFTSYAQRGDLFAQAARRLAGL